MRRRWFQSSPKLSPGCDLAVTAFAGSIAVFQSSPKLSPGCDHRPSEVVRASGVSILTQLSPGRHPAVGWRHHRFDVSILTQVVSWVRRVLGGAMATVPDVSILTQVVSWVRRHCARAYAGHAGFQSSPKLSPGCDGPTLMVGVLIEFQSSPKLSPGCDPLRQVFARPKSRFQSSPKLSPGCDAASPAAWRSTAGFQSSPKLSPGCDVGRSQGWVVVDGVSILTQVVSWVRRLTGPISLSILLFQSSPKLSPGCDTTVSVIRRVSRRFQSSPKLSPGCDHQSHPRTSHRNPFQSSPKLSPGCDHCVGRAIVVASVSILTQVVSWVRPGPSSRSHPV